MSMSNARTAAQEGQHTPYLKKLKSLLSDKNVAISHIAGYSAGYSDEILYTCAPHNNRPMVIETAQRGHGAPVWSRQPAMSTVRLDRQQFPVSRLVYPVDT